MGRLLLIAIIMVPIAEIGVFIQVGGVIGLWSTLALVILTAVAGVWLLRRQGLAAVARLRAELDAGRMPAEPLFDGVCLIFAGVLLLIPGFLTDCAGLALFVPAVRAWLRQRAARLFGGPSGPRVRVFGMSEDPRRGPFGGGPTIDGEYEDLSSERSPDDGRDGHQRLPRD